MFMQLRCPSKILVTESIGYVAVKCSLSDKAVVKMYRTAQLETNFMLNFDYFLCEEIGIYYSP